MILTVFKLSEEANEPLCSLITGTHTLGRGNILQCTDKRVSRNHIEFNVNCENATITAKHEINPCFYRLDRSKHISILQYNEPHEVTDGDSFGFLPDEYWYQIKLKEGDEINGNKENSTSLREDKNELDVTEEVNVNINDAGPSARIEEPTVPEATTATQVRIKEEVTTEEEELQETTAPKPLDVKIKDEPCDSKDGDKKTFRDRCWYGTRCYRKNLEHKATYSHPGDPDYDTDPSDDRPSCSFGRNCYRRNGDHRKHYKHSKNGKTPQHHDKKRRKTSQSEDEAVDASNILNAKRKRKVKQELDSPDDDYDYDDPFLDDGSEDEYQMESEDSDW